MFLILKNVVKKLFSLLLVGVVAISMFSFVAPTNAEAAETDSYGTLSISNWALFTASFHVTFYDSWERNLGEHDTGKLEGTGLRNAREFKIPKDTYRVHVYMAVKWGKKRTIDFYADKFTVNEKSRIELTSTNVTWDPKFDVKTNGWFGEAPELAGRGTIKFNDTFLADKNNMYFKVTFYRNDYQRKKLGEKSINLPTARAFHWKLRVDTYSETIKIPDYTDYIEAEIIQDGATIQNTNIKVCRDKVSSKSVLEINLGKRGEGLHPLEVNCSDGGWQRY